MISDRLYEEAWSKVVSPGAQVILDPSIAVDVLVGMTDSGSPFLEIRTGLQLTSFPQFELQGFGAKFSGEGADRRLTIFSNEKLRSKAFDGFVRAVLSAFYSENHVEASLAVASRWVKEWLKAHKAAATPSEASLIGLWGELYVFRELLRLGATDKFLTNAWRGPNFDSQDFSSAHASIEVKTRQASSKPNVRIVSLDQLDKKGREAALSVCVVSDSETGLSLSDLVESITPSLGHEAETLFRFKVGSIFAEYESHELAQRKFECLELATYGITPEFPRLIRDSVPAGIVSVTYTISLKSLSDFEKNTSEVFSIFVNGASVKV